ncbi:MAG: single-stranded-DNA-specific exonuclease RecJ [Pseudomonadales bacterium]|nr:single-stranded-DNA-specific exonuclease RecJ [Pseudomonadales bacterium]
MSDLQILQRVVGDGEGALVQELQPLLARIYAARGIKTVDELDLSLSRLLLPTNLMGVEHASDIVISAIQHDRRIVIVGDFDCDGATASALAVSALRAFGAKHVSFMVPNRFQFGYGLTPEIVALTKDAELIITVDNGISSIDGVAAAKAAGMQVVITDHHLAGRTLPEADAIVNPNQPGCEFASKALAGVGVIFYLLSLVRTRLAKSGWFEQNRIAIPNMAQFLDLVALGTIADVVSLDQNNRILVQEGLKRIRGGVGRPGIRALCETASRDAAKLTSQDLAFALGPRLNAAGRLDDMSLGIQCLLSEDISEARKIAAALNQLNVARREIEQVMTEDAELLVTTSVASQMQESVEQKLGLCLFDETWHQGVIGIVAGRIKEKFHRPVIAFAESGTDELKGSARSIPGVHIRDVLDAIAGRYPGLIGKFGGHAMAAGLSLRQIHFARFADAFNKEVGKWVSEADLQGTLWTDGELQNADLELSTAQLLTRSGPWGQAFPEPVFDGVFQLVDQRVVGEHHLKLSLKMDGRLVDAIAFRQAPLKRSQVPPEGQLKKSSVGKRSDDSDEVKVKVVYKLSENDFRNRVTLQLIVDHIEIVN